MLLLYAVILIITLFFKMQFVTKSDRTQPRIDKICVNQLFMLYTTYFRDATRHCHKFNYFSVFINWTLCF